MKLRFRAVRTLALATSAVVATTLAAGPASGTPAPAAAPGAGTAASPTALAAAAPSPVAEQIATGLVVPWDVAFLPDGRMVVTERPGRIRVYSSGQPGLTRQKTLKIPSIRAEGEAGAMGIAVDTDFASYPYVYVCASREYSGSGGWVNQVLRYRVSGSSWSSPTVILTGARANITHNGCSLEMDADHRLWVGIGDAGTAALAQNRTSLNGKVLRINRDGSVPDDNPDFGGRRDRVYSMGHRNPQGIAFRPGTEQVFEVEHGPNVDDEVNLLQPGGNFGWPCYTGDGNPNATSGCQGPGAYLAPQWASGDPTIATSGASFLHGEQWGDWEGSLVVPTLKQQDLRRFDVAPDGSLSDPETLYDGRFERVRGSVQGPGGDLYITTSNGTDRVLRISPGDASLRRIGGEDRYAVAAAVSRSSYPSGADEVLVAAGATFPDALAGSAAGGRLGMPVLLTRTTELPDSTVAEIRRLAPDRVTILGGTASVSGAVADALRALVPPGGVTRIGGNDRYDVAAGVSYRWSTAATTDIVFVASGEVFSDALTAAPAAVHEGAPLLLVNSRGVPSSTGEEIKRLSPRIIYMLGGRGTMPSTTVAALRHYSGASIQRLDGRDRYDVGRTVAHRFWTTSDAWVASGQVFPDGLTGGAAAGREDVPMLLARSTSVPAATGQGLLSLTPRSVTMVGGTASLGTTVSTGLRRLIGTS